MADLLLSVTLMLPVSMVVSLHFLWGKLRAYKRGMRMVFPLVLGGKERFPAVVLADVALKAGRCFAGHGGVPHPKHPSGAAGSGSGVAGSGSHPLAHIFNPIPPARLVHPVAAQRFCFPPCRVLPAGQAWPLFVTGISRRCPNALPWYKMGWESETGAGSAPSVVTVQRPQG